MALGRNVAKGAALGAAIGAAAGFFVPSIALGAANGSLLGVLGAVVLGWITAPVGACYGLVAGAAVAAIAHPHRHRRNGPLGLRLLYAVVAAGTVAAISFAMFGWTARPGGNETDLHVREDRYLFFYFPAATAAAVAAALAPRIVRAGPTDEFHDPPSSEDATGHIDGGPT